jgi:prepilin-type N-terminal cleavage/methylation domain-containing protein
MRNRIKNNQRGFTLVEMIVVMAVFMVVLMIAGDAFKTVLQQTAKLFRSEESNIEGVVGLEMFRHDLQQAGYGLFTHASPVDYTEASIDLAKPYNNVPNSTAATKVPPIALAFGNNLTGAADGVYSVLPNTDYIAIKGTTVGRSNASQRWSYLEYASGSVTPHVWKSDAENFIANEKVLLMERVSSAKGLRIVQGPVSPGFYFPFSDVAFNSPNFSNYSSTVSSSFILYGLDDENSNPRMPFNRTDYFVARPSDGTVPPVCAPNAGELYKTIVNNNTDGTGGKLTYFPVLDCVLDMQIILGWDLFTGSSPGNDGNIDVWTNANATVGATADSSNKYVTGDAALVEAQAALADPVRLRNSLKLIKVYILAQNGRKDPAYKSPSPLIVGNTMHDGTDPQGLGHSYVLPSDKLNYRWKVYQIVVRPKNLTTNQ